MRTGDDMISFSHLLPSNVILRIVATYEHPSLVFLIELERMGEVLFGEYLEFSLGSELVHLIWDCYLKVMARA